MIDSLNPDIMRDNIRKAKAETTANTDAVAELEELLGATPLETGKTITSELADHESRVTALESGGGVHLYEATKTEPLTLDGNGELVLTSEHPLYNKKVLLSMVYRYEQSGVTYGILAPSKTGDVYTTRCKDFSGAILGNGNIGGLIYYID